MATADSDSGSPLARRVRVGEDAHSNFTLNLRAGSLSVSISDNFVRTVGGIICPIAKAGASAHVLRQLHSMGLSNTLTELAGLYGLFVRAIKSGSIVVEFEESNPLSEDTFKLFVQELKTRLQELMASGNFWIERIQDPANAGAPLEPLISVAGLLLPSPGKRSSFLYLTTRGECPGRNQRSWVQPSGAETASLPLNDCTLTVKVELLTVTPIGTSGPPPTASSSRLSTAAEVESSMTSSHLLHLVGWETHMAQSSDLNVDFAQHILKTIYRELEDKVKTLSSKAVDWLGIRDTTGDINCLIKEFEENHTKISMLSQNGKGKSFILNLLLCLTADSDEEYKQNNMYLKDLTKANCRQEMAKIPQVLREDLEKLKENEKEEVFQKMIANCKRTSSSSDLKMEEAVENEKKSFDSLRGYSDGKRITSLQPYLLPVKNILNSNSTTTKCNTYLKYGPVYQMKIKYFSTEDLQSILYELVTMIKEDTQEIQPTQSMGQHEEGEESEEEVTQSLDFKLPATSSDTDTPHTLEDRLDGGSARGTNDDMGVVEDQRNTSREALEKLFCLLTTYFSDCTFDQNILQNIENPGRIQLHQGVKDLAGTSEYYMGDGEDVMKDRIFIREKLQEYITMQKIPNKERTLQNMKIAALKTVEVYAPCKILIGKEFLETPGVDDTDPLALKLINDVLDEDASLAYEQEIADEENFTAKEAEKRKNDLSALEKLFRQPLSDEFKTNVSTPSLYPVYHASVLMRDGNSTDIMKEWENSLKFTGIQSFLEEIDHFAFNRAKSSVIGIKDLLCQLEQRTEQYLKFYDWKRSTVEKIQKVLLNKESMGLLLSSASENHEQVLKNTLEKLKIARDQLISNTIEPSLKEAAEKAMEEWNNNKSFINTIGIFNPYFNGRHPAYKLKLYDIAFGNLKMPDFTNFLDEIRKIMEEYKECAIKDLSNFLALHLEKDTEKMQILVRQAAEAELDGAIGWYMGKKRLPFAEIKLHKLFQEGLVESLKQLLQQVYWMKNLEEMKEKVSKDLKSTVTKAFGIFESKLEFDLHEKRWKSFRGKIKTQGKNPKPRIWQLVTTSLQNEFKINEIEQNIKLKSDFSNMIKMVDAVLKGTRTTS
uniref:uncharacterized protein isoform X3 n=1 Tax=Pristiophorus japonicus TaxID=55135 RepID=UPI00398F1075